MKAFSIAATVIALSGTALSAQTIETVKSDIGNVVASAKTGMTLYTFRNDSQSQSNCYGDCAAAWPPFTAVASAKADGALSIIKRKDGTSQWAMNGKPLYFWAGDSARGDATGNGVGGVWDVVRN
jgi:predicted lipoprotein with Yx(FWY)xxD motif